MMMVCASNVNQYFKRRISRPYTEYTRIQLWQRDEKGEMENMVMFIVCLHCKFVCVCLVAVIVVAIFANVRSFFRCEHTITLYRFAITIVCVVYCACSRSIKVNFSIFTGSPKWNASPLCTSLCSVWYSQLDKTVDFSRPRNYILFPALTHVEPRESPQWRPILNKSYWKLNWLCIKR